MIHGSLFSGIGGFDLAAEWMGWTNAFHCEWEEFPRKVLQYHFPESKSYGDINETDFTIWNKKIDILTGGFPCQPYSAAGKRLGKEDERHLWPEMLRAIREIEPRWIIGENVYGLVSWNEGLVFDEVQVDLENEGYEVQPYILPAASVNAPHRRDRVWFVAYSDKRDDRRATRKDEGKSRKKRLQERHEVRQSTQSSEVQWDAADTSSKRAWKQPSENRGWENRRSYNNGENADATNTNKVRLQFSEDTRKVRGAQSQVCGAGGEFADAIKADGEKWATTKAYLQRGKKCNISTKPSKQEFTGGKSYETNATNTSDKGLQGGEINGSITSIRQERNEQPTRCIPPTWDEFPTQPPVCGRDDGIPRELDSITFPKWRNESIKAYGNAIVPQVAYQLFKTIRAYEIQRNTRS